MAESAEHLRVAVVGATGYAGIEVVRLVLGHPHFDLALVCDRKLAGQPIAETYPALVGVCDLRFSLPDPEEIVKQCDLAFLAVPHTASLALTPKLMQLGVSVIDLSADYRLKDPAVYEEWYETPHTSPELLADAAYGLPELNRPALAGLAEKHAAGESVLVAAAGCYPTATALAAAPTLAAGLVEGDLVISDAISGVSGAGRTPNARTHFCHADESVEPYGVAHHRHTPEMEQSLSAAAGGPINVVFTPHLAPLKRGLLATVYLPLKEGADLARVEQAYHDAYDAEPLVSVLPEGQMPATGSVAGTARAQIGLGFDGRRRGMLIAACAIDNLGKGAAAQAVQCANAVCGFPETEGLLAPAPVV